MKLSAPSPQLWPSYLESINEMRALGEHIWEELLPKPGEDPQAFIKRLNHDEIHNPEPGRVPQTTYWGVDGNQVIGRIALRHHLNDALKEFGGHIGYEVRPSARRKGFATEMLRQLLKTPEARAIGRLLITCAPDNVGSNNAIRANGGILEKTVFVKERQRDTNYYWVSAQT